MTEPGETEVSRPGARVRTAMGSLRTRHLSGMVRTDHNPERAATPDAHGDTTPTRSARRRPRSRPR